MSSKRSWPSLFRSKPIANPQYLWQDGTHSLLMPNFYSPTGCQVQFPDPKPRWNPKPEQVRILEDIFNSGMVNPPRDEVSKISRRLREYGQVGDANVFYWFQNRKSRSKFRDRTKQSDKPSRRSRTTGRAPPPAKSRPTSSSSSPEPRSRPDHVQKKVRLGVSSSLSEMINYPTTSITNTVFTPTTGDILQEPLVLPVQNVDGISTMTQEQCFSDIASVHQLHHQSTGHLSYAAFLQELMADQSNDHTPSMSTSTIVEVSDAAVTATAPGTYLPVGVGSIAPAAAPRRMQVFIDNEVYEVGPGPVNIRGAFGNKILVHISGQPILTDEGGFTLQPLQHGYSYYLVNVEE